MCLKVKDLIVGEKYSLNRGSATVEATFLGETAKYGNTNPYSLAFVGKSGSCFQNPIDVDHGHVIVTKLPKIEKRYINAYGTDLPTDNAFMYAMLTHQAAKNKRNATLKCAGVFEVTYTDGLPTDVQLIKE